MSDMENPRDMLRIMKLSPPGEYGNDVYLPHEVTDAELAELGYYKLEDEPGRLFSKDVCQALESMLKHRGIYPPSGRHDPKHPSIDAETILETILAVSS